MDLYGWKYEGRTISDKLQEQIMGIIEFLNDPVKVANRKWGKELQISIGRELDISDGQVRTIKRMMEEFDILIKGKLNRNIVPKRETIYSENGKFLLKVFENEKLLSQSNDAESIEELKKFRKIYKLSYFKILTQYTIENEDGTKFRQAFVLLKALRKFGHLTYWEWYLLNTFITSENDKEQEEEFEEHLMSFRSGKIKESELAIKKNSLSHSYILNNFKYVGIIDVKGRKEDLKITINKKNKESLDLMFKEGESVE